MAAEEELELEERDIFDVGAVSASSLDTGKEEPSTDEPGAASSTDDETTASTHKDAALQMPGPPRPMIGRKIRRSLDQSAARHIRSSSRDIEEDDDTVEDTAGLTWLASAQQGKPLFGVHSLPASHAKLGTSAPINIPTQSWSRRAEPSSKADKLSSTFQPPHVLSQQEEDRQGRTQ
ncbi:hypothetical protein WJX84_004284 [Apatococcus fuscideae]|uniref:Uncharacterized protein n=1 Tax=Apatococcus fuscideae TaxID=2026836 RepID=A0AAW1SSI4_9CHLO